MYGLSFERVNAIEMVAERRLGLGLNVWAEFERINAIEMVAERWLGLGLSCDTDNICVAFSGGQHQCEVLPLHWQDV